MPVTDGTKVGSINVLRLISKAGLAVAVAGALATAVAAPSLATPRSAQSGSARAGSAQADAARAGEVVIRDVMVPVPGQHAVPAYLVRSAGPLRPHSHAGILFLHWLGQIHSDRTEFLAEAVQLASRGAVSLLPAGNFPYVASPVGDKRDVTAIKRQLAVFRAAFNYLLARRSVSHSRLAVVGHDYGAMYGALLASSDRRVHVAVLAAPDATWGHWFVKYWLEFTGKKAARYKALFAPLQPVRHVARLGSHELFQWAGQDIFVSAAVRKQFAAAAPKARVELYPNSDHQLTSAAQADRDAFLQHQLGLTP